MHGAVAILRVVLSDPDKQVAHDDAYDARRKQPQVIAEHQAHGNVESRDRQRRGHGIAAVERAHGVLVFVGAHDENSGDTGNQPEGARHQRKKNPEQAELLEKRHTQNHGADVLGGGRFKEVSAPAGAVAHVVTHQVRDHGGVARVVFGDSRFHLANQVGAHVRRLGVNPAAELRKQRHEAGPEAEAHDQVRNGLWVVEAPVEVEQSAHAQQRHRHHRQPGNRAAPQRQLQGAIQAAARRARRPDVGADGDKHPDETREPRAQSAGEKRHHRSPGQREIRSHVEQEENRGDHHAQQVDRLVLPAQKCLRAFLDGVGDFLHGGRAGVGRQNMARQQRRYDQGKHADTQDDGKILHGILSPASRALSCLSNQ